MSTEIITFVLVAVVLILFNSIPKWGVFVSNVFLGLLFLFIQSNINESLGNFYAIMVLMNVAFGIYSYITSVDVGEENVDSLFGLHPVLVSIMFFIGGAILFLLLLFLQGKSAASIFGVPGLSVVPLSLTSSFTVAGIAAIGFIENRFFIGLLNILRNIVFPFFAGFVPFLAIDFVPAIIGILLVSFAFAMFHLSAYALSLGSLVWAFLVMIIWLTISVATPFEEATSWSHYLWNGFVNLKDKLSVVFDNE